MDKYPVYRALYQPMLVFGVPLMALIMEAAFLALFCALRLWAVLPVIVLVHLCLRYALRSDPYIVTIVLDLITLATDGKEARHEG